MTKLGWQLIIGGIVVLSLFGGGMWTGYKIHKCPITTNDTTYVHDTVTHTITNTVDHYTMHTDTIIYNTVPEAVDTAAILADYYASHIYDRHWFDDNLDVQIKDSISQNKVTFKDFKYKWLQPTTIVNNYTDNSVNYGKYIQFGLSMPVYKFTNDSIKLNALNKLALKLDYIFPKGSVGINWQPQGNVVGIEFAATLIKFKNKK